MKNIFELVYLIYEGKLVTQREFADRMFLSLGKINSLLKEVVSEGYVFDRTDGPIYSGAVSTRGS